MATWANRRFSNGANYADENYPGHEYESEESVGQYSDNLGLWQYPVAAVAYLADRNANDPLFQFKLSLAMLPPAAGFFLWQRYFGGGGVLPLAPPPAFNPRGMRYRRG